MVKLPDVPSLGPSPVPDSRAPMYVPSASPVPATEMSAGQDFAQLASTLDKAAERQMTFTESADRLRAIRDFRERAANETTRLTSQDDLADPNVTKSYGKFMNDLEQSILKSHSGREESRLKLEEQISSMKLGLIEKVANQGAEALHKKSITELGEELNQHAQAVYDKPESLHEAFRAFQKIAADQPLSPEQRRTQESAALGYLAETAATRMILQNRTNDARDILGDPDVKRAMPEARRTRLLRTLEAAEKPMSPKDRYMNTDAGLADIAPTGGGAPKIVIPALPKTPMVTIDQRGEGRFVEKLGELNAEKISKLNDNAQTATLTLTEIDRAKTALDSGKFTTGSFGDFRAEVARFAEFMGAPDDIKKAIGDAATADTFEAATKRLALNEIPKLERTLVAGLKIVQEALPALSRTPEGNRILLDVMERVAQREIQIAEVANDVATSETDTRKIGKAMLTSMRELEKQDPIITDELKKRIQDGSKSAPKSVADVFGELKGTNAGPKTVGTQAEVDALPSGTEFIWGPTKKKMKKE